MQAQNDLNDVQFDILDALYFVEPYERILSEIPHTEPIVRRELLSMIKKGWVQVLRFDEKKGDYLRTHIIDVDNMQEFAFLATKEGLLRHNGH